MPLFGSVLAPFRTWPARRIHGCALFAAALILRIGYSLSLPSIPLSPDEFSFDSIAWSVASHGTYADAAGPTTARTPGYVVFMAAVYRIAGHRIMAVRLAQALLGILLVWILMKLGRRFGMTERAVLAIGWVAALYPFFIYYESHMLAEAYLAFWLAVSIHFFLRWQEKPASLARGVAWGLAFSVLSLTKTLFIPLFCMVWAIEFVVSCADKLRYARWRSLTATALAFSFLILGWGLRNQNVLGHFMLDSHGGKTLLETIVFHDAVKSGDFPMLWENHPLRKNTVGWNEGVTDTYYLRLARQYIQDHPGLYLRQCLVRFKDFWRFYPRQDFEYREGRRFLTVISLLTEPWLIVLGMIGMFHLRRRLRQIYPIYGAIVIMTVVHTLVTGQMRYRLPLMPYLIVGSVYAATQFVGRRGRINP